MHGKTTTLCELVVGLPAGWHALCDPFNDDRVPVERDALLVRLAEDPTCIGARPAHRRGDRIYVETPFGELAMLEVRA